MKKKIILGVVAGFMFSMTTGFAAANLVDVPTSHWAYDSVSKLVQAGLIDGYSDKSFKGEKALTRYEMAVIVARSMDNYSKADDKNKGEILKLITEFSKELDKMDARMTKIEKSQPKIVFDGGRLDFRYTSKSWTDKTKAAKSVESDRFHLGVSAKIDNDTSIHARFTNVAPNSTDFSTKSWTDWGSGINGAYFDYMYVDTKFGPVKAKLGRQDVDILADPDGIIMERNEINWSAARFTLPTGKFTFEGIYGRVAKGVTYSSIAASNTVATKFYNKFSNVDARSFSVAYKDGKFDAGIGQTVFFNNTGDLMKWNLGYVRYQLAPKLVVAEEYLKNTLATKDNAVAMAMILWGDPKMNKKGNMNIDFKTFVAGKNAVVNRYTNIDTLDSDNLTDNWRATTVKFNYAYTDNLSSEIRYIRNIDKANGQLSSTALKAYLHYKF